MNKTYNIQSVDVEGGINSTAFAVKTNFAESDVTHIIIVPKEADAPLPTNYESILTATERVVTSHHVLDEASMINTVRFSTGIIERGDWEI